MFVPIAHILRYGFSSPIPLLYGMGNTLFYALLMHGKALTLSNYFAVFPVGQLLGILAIGFALLYATRSIYALPLAIALTLLPLWKAGYEVLQLAPGFNPARYVGLALQMASLFFLARGRSTWPRAMGVVLAFAFSLFWNKEFALLGLIGQGLLLLSPSVPLRSGIRIAALAALVAVLLVGFTLLGDMSHGFIETVQTSFYGIAVPTGMPTRHFVIFVLEMALLIGLLGWGSQVFETRERIARLCLLPVLGLLMIKYLYNLSTPHWCFTMVFLLPSMIVYWNWQTPKRPLTNLTLGQRERIQTTAIVILCGLCFLGSFAYSLQAHALKAQRIEPYAQNKWDRLGETFETVTPAAPIADRMQAVQAEMKTGDTVLFLSPFDHLMSFYVPAERYCGHFEILSNLVTNKNVEDVENCVRTGSSVLVVYDASLDKLCPDAGYSEYFSPYSCAQKRAMKLEAHTMMDHLRKDLTLVNKSGDLSFYRRKPPF